jgi:hypothetical protein
MAKKSHNQLPIEQRLMCSNFFFRAYSQGFDLAEPLQLALHYVQDDDWISGSVALELMHLALREGYSGATYSRTIQTLIECGTLTPHKASGGYYCFFGDRGAN